MSEGALTVATLCSLVLSVLAAGVPGGGPTHQGRGQLSSTSGARSRLCNQGLLREGEEGPPWLAEGPPAESPVRTKSDVVSGSHGAQRHAHYESKDDRPASVHGLPRADPNMQVDIHALTCMFAVC